MTARGPSAAAIAQLRELAAQLDVDDLLDLCYAFAADLLRIGIYLDALRGRGGERAQAAACLLCFDLARHGDVRREAELKALLPVLDDLIDAEAAQGKRALMPRLIGDHPYLLELWRALKDHARTRDRRSSALAPSLAEISLDIDDVDIEIEVDLFDSAELQEIELSLDDLDRVLYLDDEAADAFRTAFGRLCPLPPAVVFIADTTADLERLERMRTLCVSFESKVPTARQMLPIVEMFLATHSRATGLFGRRNRERDVLLESGLRHLLALDAPPTEAVAWLDATGFPTAIPGAWEKFAEVLLDVCAFVPHVADTTPAAVAKAWIADERSVEPPRVLSSDRERRRGR